MLSRCVFVLTGCMVLGCSASGQDELEDGDQVLQDIVHARLSRLECFAAKYHIVENFLALPDQRADDPLEGRTSLSQPVERRCTLQRDGIVIRFDSTILGDRRGLPQMQEIYLTPEVIERLITTSIERPPFGQIDTPKVVPDIWLDFALGIRKADSMEWWTAAAPPENLTYIRVDETRFTASVTDDLGTIHEWTFDLSIGGALTRYTLRSIKRAYITFELENSDFRLVDGLMVPHRIIKRRWRPGPDGHRVQGEETTITVEEFEVLVPDQAGDSLRIDWPAGTFIYDTRTNEVFRAAPDGSFIKVADQSRPDVDQSNGISSESDGISRSGLGTSTSFVPIVFGIGLAVVAIVLRLASDQWKRGLDGTS